MLTQKLQWLLSFPHPWQDYRQRHKLLCYKRLELQFQISLLFPVKDRLLVLRDLELLIVSEARNLAQTQN